MKKRDILLNTEAHREAFDEYADTFRSVEAREHWRPSELFRHWIEAAFRALYGKTVFGKTFDDSEAEYMRIVKRCQKPQETMRDFAVMLGCTARALSAAPVDFIGPLFSSLAADDHMGQFFTPYSLSRMMAGMIIDANPREILKDKPFLLLHEPACGVGGMMLAANEVLRERGIDIARHSHWVAVDVDFRAICGAYIQAALTDASATIIHGNTLSLAQHLTTITPAALMFPKRASQTMPAPQLPRFVKGAQPAPTPEPVANKRGQFAFTF